jgi:hypothetical protein
MRGGSRLVVLVVVLAVALGALVYLLTAGGGNSGLKSQIMSDAKGQFFAQSVSCSTTDREPNLTSEPIFACKISGVARANRPGAHTEEATFTRCFIRTAGGQTVDVSRAVSVLSQDRGKTAPCF